MASRAPTGAEVVPERPLVRRLWRAAQGIAVAAIGLVAAAAIARLPELAGVAYSLGALTGGAAALASLVLRGRRPDWKRAVHATASAEGLRVQGTPLVETAEMGEAIVTPRRAHEQPWLWRLLRLTPDEDRYDVEIRRAGRFAWPIRFATRTLEEARAIVEALGLGAARRAMTRKVMSPVIHPKVTFPMIFGSFALAILGGVLAGVSQIPAFAMLALGVPLSIGIVYTLGLVKTKVTIGADGVTTRWLGRPTTIPLGEIARVEIVPVVALSPAKVRLHKKDGTTVDLVIGLRGGSPFEPYVLADECARIAERIREAMALRGNAEPFEFRAWAAHRGQLPIAEWIAVLRGAVEAYRDDVAMPFTKADLWAIVENASAHPAERAAAAVAVSAKPDPATKARLRNVAASTAVPRFRVLCEAAAEADDEGVASALEALRAEAPPDAEVPPVAEAAPPPLVRVEVPAEEAADDEAADAERARLVGASRGPNRAG